MNGLISRRRSKKKKKENNTNKVSKLIIVIIESMIPSRESQRLNIPNEAESFPMQYHNLSRAQPQSTQTTTATQLTINFYNQYFLIFSFSWLTFGFSLSLSRFSWKLSWIMNWIVDLEIEAYLVRGLIYFFCKARGGGSTKSTLTLISILCPWIDCAKCCGSFCSRRKKKIKRERGEKKKEK